MEPSCTNLSLPRLASISTRLQVAPAVRTLEEKSKSELRNAHGFGLARGSRKTGGLPVANTDARLIKSQSSALLSC
jgi:hypothetical protein